MLRLMEKACETLRTILASPPAEPVAVYRAELEKVAGDLNKLRARVEGVLCPNSGFARGET